MEKTNTWRVTIATNQGYEEINYFNDKSELEYFLADYAVFISHIVAVEHKIGYQWSFMNLDSYNKIYKDAYHKWVQSKFDAQFFGRK